MTKKTGWTTVAFGDVVRLSKERANDPAAEGFERFVGLEHLEPGDLRIRSWGDVADGTTFTSVFRPGHVLFGKRRAYQRKVAVADFSGVCSGDIYVLEPKDGHLLPELLPFICQTDSFFEHAVGTSAGSLSPRTNWTSLADFKFGLPPIEEQRRIVSALSALQSHIESLIQLGSMVQSLRFSALNQFFKPRVGAGQPLGHVASIHAGGTPSKSRKSYWGGMRPWASGKDMKVRDLTTTEETLSEEGWKVAKIAPQGATLIVVRGMILAHTFPVARCLVPMAFNQYLRAIIPGDHLLPEYVTLWAEWMGPWFLSMAGESSHGTKRIEGHILESALIPVPTKDEQMEFLRTQQSIICTSIESGRRLLSAHGLKQRMFETLLEDRR